MQKDDDKTIPATKRLASAYENFTTVIDCMCNEYDDSDYLRMIQDEVREMFVSFCNAPTADKGSWRECNVEGPPAISERKDLNTDVMK